MWDNFGEQLLVARYQMRDKLPALESNCYPFLMLNTWGCDTGLPEVIKGRSERQSFFFFFWLVNDSELDTVSRLNTVEQLGYFRSLKVMFQHEVST
jgi:hypothetical protein